MVQISFLHVQKKDNICTWYYRDRKGKEQNIRFVVN